MDNFPLDNNFGIDNNVNDVTELIFGLAKPKDAKPIEPVVKKNIATPIKDEDENLDEQSNENKPVDKKITADDFLNDLNQDSDADDEDSKQVSPKIITPKENNEPDSSEEEHSEFLEITKELVKLGIFKDRDEDETDPIKTGEAFKNRFAKEVAEKANEDIYNFIMSKHGEEGMEVFDALFVKGVPIKEYLTKYSEIQSFENLDMSLDENQKTIFREGYRRQGMAEDKIERKLQRAIDYGDLEEESKDIYEIILKQDREENNNRIAQAQQAEQAKRDMKIKYLNDMNTILASKLKEKEFDGIPVTEKTARETFEYLTKEKWITEDGKRLTDFENDLRNLDDPKNHELRVKLALLLKNKIDLSKIKSTLISKDSNELFGKLVRKENQIKRTSKTSRRDLSKTR